jgi:hypothetical protein
MRFILRILSVITTFYVCITLNSAFLTKHGCIYEKTKDLEIFEAITCININDNTTLRNRVLYYTLNKNNESLYLVFYEYYIKLSYHKELNKKEKDIFFRLLKEFFTISTSSSRVKNYKMIKIIETYLKEEDKKEIEKIINSINNNNTKEYKEYKL